MKPRGRSQKGLFVYDEIVKLKTWATTACAKGDPAGILLVTLLGTAGRAAEVAALRVKDVRQGIDGPEVTFPKTKGGGAATVPISVDTFEVMVRWCKGRPADAPLIPARGGGFMHPITLWRRFKDAVRDAGIQRNVGVHASRHAAAYLLLKATGDLTQVQAFLRHTNIATTAAWYKHIHQPKLRAGLKEAGI